MTRKPILVGLAPAAVTAIVLAIVNLMRAFNIGDITDEQVEAINGLLAVILPFLGVGGIVYAQDRSTPVAAPALPQGTTVEVVTPPGQENTTVVI